MDKKLGNILVLGDGQTLSRRRARKLAYLYRGGNRGQRYTDFLAGKKAGFFVRDNRLLRLPKSGRVTTVTVHSEGAIQTIRNAMAGVKTYSIESPPELIIQR